MLYKKIIKNQSNINLTDILKKCDLLVNFRKQMNVIARNRDISKNDIKKLLSQQLYSIYDNTKLKKITMRIAIPIIII